MSLSADFDEAKDNILRGKLTRLWWLYRFAVVLTELKNVLQKQGAKSGCPCREALRRFQRGTWGRPRAHSGGVWFHHTPLLGGFVWRALGGKGTRAIMHGEVIWPP